MKVVVWGHPLHSHTHSYIHAAFARAFRWLGHETLWLSDSADVRGVDFAGALFFTEGQADKNIPLRDDCLYVLHNCDDARYRPIPEDHRLALQVYTSDAIARYKPQKLSECAYLSGRCLLQPWATDLLPHEIDMSWANAARERTSHWIGTVGSGEFGNEVEIGDFKAECRANGVAFETHRGASFEENRALVTRSWMAPALHGAWQRRTGYVACRVFKNISYGQLGVTNCAAANAVMENGLVCDQNVHRMCDMARPILGDVRRIQSQMLLVRDKHTYVNRIQAIMNVLGVPGAWS